MTPDTHAITIDECFEPPARVMACDFQGGAASRSTWGPYGTTHCEVLAHEPERLLRISWKNPPLDTTVTWRLAPEGSGTRLHFEHAGFDLADPRQRRAYEGMSSGWRGKLWTRLAEVLAPISRPSGSDARPTA